MHFVWILGGTSELTRSKKGPVTTAVQRKSGFADAFFLRYSMISTLRLKTGTSSLAYLLAVLLPNSLGKNLLTPAFTAASITTFCVSIAAPARLDTTASWPWRALSREASE